MAVRSRHAVALLLLGLVALSAVHNCVCAADSEDVDESDVLVLGDGNFTEAVGKQKYTLVEYYAPWCGHCKSLKPHYAKAATALKETDIPVALAKVDATEEPDLAKRFEVQGYPTLKWFVDGEAQEYSGGRTADDIVSWIKKKTGPPAVTITEPAGLETAKADNKAFLVAYFDKLEGDAFDAFQSVARSTDDVAFYQTTSDKVAAELGLKAPHSYALVRMWNDEEETVVSEGHSAVEPDNSVKDNILAFLAAEKLPAYLEFGPDTQKLIFGSGIDKQVIVIGSRKQLATDGPTIAAVKAAHGKHKGQVVMVTSDTGKEHSGAIINFFELDKEAEDVQVVGFDTGKRKKFKSAEEPTEEGILKFTEEFLAGTLPVTYKSEPVVADNKDGEVVVVVGKSVDDIVMDPERDVLLEVYAPWCGHCKSLAPIYAKLAKRFKKVDSVVIAKMDGTTNEHEALEGKVEGFPTLLFYPAGADKTPIPFSGERTLLGMTKFIKANAKKPFELPKKGGAKDESEYDESHDEL